MADALEVADDGEEAVLQALELGLALFPEAGHGGFFGLEVRAQGDDGLAGGFDALGELGAGDVVVDPLGVLGAAEVGLAGLMRRYRHRLSRDVDIFVPDPQYLGYLDPDLNETVEALTPRHLKEADFLRLYFDRGEVDFIAAAPVTDHATTVETVLDRKVRVDTPIEIVAKKIRYRGAQFTARDVFDFALVAGKEPKEISRIKPLLREKRDVILQRARDPRLPAYL